MSDPTSDPTNDPTTDEAATSMDGTDTTGTDTTGTATTGTATYDATEGPTSEPTPAPGELPSGRHPVNIGHLVMGLAFAGLVVIWALIEGDVIADSDIRWLLPIPWVLAGTAGLLAVTLGNRRRRNP